MCCNQRIGPLTIIAQARNSGPLPYLGAYMHPTTIIGCFLGPNNLQIYTTTNQGAKIGLPPSSIHLITSTVFTSGAGQNVGIWGLIQD